ncbi:hypothetical protein NQ318_003773 [Aromia moschata]|uniref:Uncharacterized protein n=1 Tax=Aromia moschata TaxID=1265417 RepID=A0AAV8YJC7_9CUCU|nr:hypothetical protein NQ318_003773 [Aromia moschata]
MWSTESKSYQEENQGWSTSIVCLFLPEAMKSKLKPEFDTSGRQTANSLLKNSCCYIPTARKLAMV